MLRVLLPYVRLTTLLRWLAPSRIPTTAMPELLNRAVRYTDALLWRLHFPLPGTCLPRSLVLYYFATRLGYTVKFCCGVQRGDGTLKGHAWLTRDGNAFLEPEDPEKQFVVTFSFPEVKGA
jgi:hypothetical protein